MEREVLQYRYGGGPGTQEFKHKYEEAIGHKATSISIADLRKYAKQFGVEYYAEQAIEYALNH